MEKDECANRHLDKIHEIIVSAVLNVIYFYLLYSVVMHLKKLIQNTTKKVLICSSGLLLLEMIFKIVTVVIDSLVPDG